ncbi:MAG: hypothetical protein ACRDZ4_22195 [Egibacteraceae bacterium]
MSLTVMNRSPRGNLGQSAAVRGEHAPFLGGRASPPSDPRRVALVDGNVVVTVPCCFRPVVLRGEEVHPRSWRPVPCAHGVWRLEFLSDAQATWTAVWTPVWSEPTLRSRRGLARWREARRR